MPVLSRVIAEPILEVHRTQSICDEDILLLDIYIYFFSISKSKNVTHFRKEKIGCYCFLVHFVKRDRIRNRRLSLTWQEATRLFVFHSNFQLCLLNVSKHWSNSCSHCWSWRAPLGIPPHKLSEGTKNSFSAQQVKSERPAVFRSFSFPSVLVVSSLPSPKLSLVAEPSHTHRWKCVPLAAAGFVVLKF